MSPLEFFAYYVIPRTVIKLVFFIATFHTFEAWKNQDEGAHRQTPPKQP